jgi:hypothetical protein
LCRGFNELDQRYSSYQSNDPPGKGGDFISHNFGKLSSDFSETRSEEYSMSMPFPYWIFVAGASGANAARMLNTTTAAAEGKKTKVVHCEGCRQHYAYQLTRTAGGAVNRTSGDAHRAALLLAEANLQRLLATGIEAVPCPTCGSYQSNMIPELQSRHHRWMVSLGQCLTVGLVPVAVFGGLWNGYGRDTPRFPWPIFVAGLLGVLTVGIAMLIWRHCLNKKFNPNDEDAEARKRYGQSHAELLSEHEANDVLAHGRPSDWVPSSADGAAGTTSSVGNGPPRNETPEAIAGCLVFLVLIGIGVIWWNLWQKSIETKAKADADAAVQRMYDPPVMPEPLPPINLPQIPQPPPR